MDYPNSENNHELFYKEILNALDGFLSAKLLIPVSELNKEKISEALNARDTKGRPRVSDEARKFIKNAARKKRIRLVLDEGNIEIAALTPIERGVLAITSIAWAPVLGVLTILTAGQWQWPLQALQRGWHAIMGDELMPAPDPAPRPYPAQEEVSVKETAGGSAIPAPAVPTPAVPDLMHDEGLTDDLATGRASPNPPNTLGKK